jgi:hypothetical protein
MKIYWGIGDIAPLILWRRHRWRWVVSFTPRLLYPQGKNPWYPLDRRLGGPQIPSGRGSEEKNSQPPPGIETENPDCPARRPALYRLSYYDSFCEIRKRELRYAEISSPAFESWLVVFLKTWQLELFEISILLPSACLLNVSFENEVSLNTLEVAYVKKTY